jgi:hypothetical protein
MWANSDAYAARRWYSAWASLGFAALGAGLMLSCTGSAQDLCGDHPAMRHMQFAVGAVELGFFSSTFLFSMLAPPPSPRALQRTLRGRGPEQRYDRVLDFLEQRDRLRRVGNYIALPWGLTMGGGAVLLGHEAPTGGGRAVMYGFGSALLAVTTVLFVYELLRTPDADRLAAGERPSE